MYMINKLIIKIPLQLLLRPTDLANSLSCAFIRTSNVTAWPCSEFVRFHIRLNRPSIYDYFQNHVVKLSTCTDQSSARQS